MTFEYSSYEKNLEKYTNQMNLKESVKTKRHGKRQFRDGFITVERYYSEGNHYLSLFISFITMIVTWTALSGEAIKNFNIWWMVLSVLLIGATAFFGYLSYTRLGLVNRYNELMGKTDSGRFQLWAELQDVKAQNVAMLKQMDALITYHKKHGRKKK